MILLGCNDPANKGARRFGSVALFTMHLRLIILTIFLLLGGCLPVFAQSSAADVPLRTAAKDSARGSQTYTKEGVSVEFSIQSISTARGQGSGLVADTDAIVSFKIVDANERKALSNLRPAAWIDRREPGQVAPDARECREKVQSFLQPSFNRRPNIDLNAYLILALNLQPNISVIDPISGFGGSKLYTLVPLASSGEDWIMSVDKKRLYVSMPRVGQIAVVDTTAWKVVANIDAGINPTRIALQHDGRYLWVGNDDVDEKNSGVTVIDALTLKRVAEMKTGAGHHEIAFTENDQFAFITNKHDGTLSVMDVRKLARGADVKVGALPVSIAFSSISKAVYVANEGDGTIVVIDGQRHSILARMSTARGVRSLRLPPDGHFGFVVNPVTNKVYIFDLASNRVRTSAPVEPGADQLTFTREFAYVRARDSEFVTMIKISDLDKSEEVAVTRFPAGQKAPSNSPASSFADAMVPAPGEGAVFVANPADKVIYYYTEGMAAPMGSFQNYRRDPKALLILDHSLIETARGTYATTVRLPGPGRYDIAFLLDSPRVVNCFDVTIAENAAQPKPAAAIKIDPLSNQSNARVGEPYNLRFRVTDAASNQGKVNLQDMGVLVFLAPGIWERRDWARSLGDGVYEMSFVPPRAGLYYLYFQCPSLGVQYKQVTPLILEATKK